MALVCFGADRGLQAPLLSNDNRVWALPVRPVQVDGEHHWRAGICLGPNASGEGSNAHYPLFAEPVFAN